MSEENITVAVVEDADEIREGLRILINGSAGFECLHVFTSAEEALEKMPVRGIDIVLMDIGLPGMNGIECLRTLYKGMQDTQFMMYTIFDDDDCIFEALRAGAAGYILKRTSPARIMEAIRDLYEGGSPMSSGIARRVIDLMRNSSKPSEAAGSLTERQLGILDLLSKGYHYKEIAAKLGLSTETVKKHIHNIYDRLHVQNRTEAINKAFQK